MRRVCDVLVSGSELLCCSRHIFGFCMRISTAEAKAFILRCATEMQYKTPTDTTC
uniref:Uncharacterized protein n=1 Tax=Anguilla anguilla TaxID=7936 RepID=A0A0E9VV94_ANGAN